MNGSSNLDETYSEYSLAPTDGLIRFWRSKVEVIAGCRRRAGEGIHVNASRNPSSSEWVNEWMNIYFHSN